MVEAYLETLVEGGALTEVQHNQIHHFYDAGNFTQLSAWLDAKENSGQITSDTRIYLDALLELTPPAFEAFAPASASYTGNHHPGWG